MRRKIVCLLSAVILLTAPSAPGKEPKWKKDVLKLLDSLETASGKKKTKSPGGEPRQPSPPKGTGTPPGKAEAGKPLLQSANLALAGGRFSEAVEGFSKVLALDPTAVPALVGRAKAQAALKNFGSAVQDYSAALDLQPDDGEARLQRGVLRTRIEDYAGAIQDFDTLLTADPRNLFALCERAAAKAKSGDLPGARADLETARGLDPANPLVISGLQSLGASPAGPGSQPPPTHPAAGDPGNPGPGPTAGPAGTPSQPPPASASSAGKGLLFADGFQRPDSDQVGDGWEEFLLRQGKVLQENSPGWKIAGNTLVFEATGTGDYIEDFVMTREAFPLEGLRIEFQMRSTVGTKAGFVGPSCLLLGDPLKRTQATTTSCAKGLIGFQAWNNYTNQGTAGALFLTGRPEDFIQELDRKLGAVNQPGFASVLLEVSGGKLSYQDSSGVGLDFPLTLVPGPDDRRHVSFGARLYDRGLSQKIEIRNLRVTSTAPAGPPAGPASLPASATLADLPPAPPPATITISPPPARPEGDPPPITLPPPNPDLLTREKPLIDKTLGDLTQALQAGTPEAAAPSFLPDRAPGYVAFFRRAKADLPAIAAALQAGWITYISPPIAPLATDCLQVAEMEIQFDQRQFHIRLWKGADGTWRIRSL